MARTVKQPEIRKSEILAAAQGLFMTHGYSKTSIRQIIDSVGIAKGTFYHHFDSKHALLDTIADQMRAQAMTMASPIADDPTLSAAVKLNTIFSSVGAWKATQKSVLMPMLEAMRRPENLLMRHRMEQASTQAMHPMLTQIISQGIDEGVFHVTDASLTATLILTISAATSNRLGDMLLEEVGDHSEQALRQLAQSNEEAVNRILGCPEHTVKLLTLESLLPWFQPES